MTMAECKGQLFECQYFPLFTLYTLRAVRARICTTSKDVQYESGANEYVQHGQGTSSSFGIEGHYLKIFFKIIITRANKSIKNSW